MRIKYRALLVLFLTLNTGLKAFNPVMPDNLVDGVYSFRAISTAFMFDDYIDFAQNPLLLPKAEKNAIFTGLSNFTSSEFLFSNMGDNDIKLGGIYESGIGSEGFIFTLLNSKTSLLNPLGGIGETTLDSVVYEDVDLDGYPDIRRNKYLYSNAWQKSIKINFSLSFYLDRDDYGIGFFFAHTEKMEQECDGGDTLNPLGVFVYNEQIINNMTGNLISTVNGIGSGKETNGNNISLAAIGTNFSLNENPVRALLMYEVERSELKENYSAVITRDNAPLDPDNIHIVQKLYERAYNDYELRRRLSLNMLLWDNEFDITYAVNGGIIKYAGKVGTLIDMNSIIQEDQLSDSIMVDINRTADVVSLSEPVGTGYDGYFTFLKGLSLSDKGRMRFGVSLYALKEKVKRQVFRSDTTYSKFIDGDTEPNDADDFEGIQYSSVSYDSVYEHAHFAVRVPCGFYIGATKSIELRFGVIEEIRWDKAQNYLVYTGITPLVREIIRGDGTHTIQKSGLSYENNSQIIESIVPSTRFFYGIGIDVLENLSIDLMNYATITNLNNWKLSVVFKF